MTFQSYIVKDFAFLRCLRQTVSVNKLFASAYITRYARISKKINNARCHVHKARCQVHKGHVHNARPSSQSSAMLTMLVLVHNLGLVHQTFKNLIHIIHYHDRIICIHYDLDLFNPSGSNTMEDTIMEKYM